MKFIKEHKIALIILLAINILLTIPILVKGYIYPIAATDILRHTTTISQMEFGKPMPEMLYIGQAIIGYPLNYISKLSGIDLIPLLIILNILAIIASGLTIYLILSKLVNKKTGILSILIVLLCSQGLITYFSFGTLFGIISMGILLPLTFYYFIKYAINPNKKYAISLCFLLILSSIFHTSGIYILLSLSIISIIYLTYLLIKKEYKTIINYTTIPGIVLIISAIGIFTLSRTILNNSTNEFVRESIKLNFVKLPGVSINNFILTYLTPIIFALLITGILGILTLRKRLIMKKESWILIAILITLAIGLSYATFSGMPPEPTRIAMDLSIILAILASIFIGILTEVKHKSEVNGKILFTSIILLIGFGSYPTIGGLIFGY